MLQDQEQSLGTPKNKILDESLLAAIDHLNPDKVLSLLREGTNPNSLLMISGKEGHPPLYHAMIKFTSDDKIATQIITYLIEFGADYLENPFNYRYKQYENLFHFAVLSRKIPLDCCKLIITLAIKTNKLSQINLGYITEPSTQKKQEILFYLIEQGVTQGADEALREALGENSRADVSYRLIKTLYEISCNDKTESSFNYNNFYPSEFVRAAIKNDDFEFALYLLETYSLNITSCEKFGGSPILLQLLSVPATKTNFFHSALLTLMLNTNHRGFQPVYEYMTKNNMSKNHLLQPPLVALGKLIDMKLFLALVTFINPLQNTFPIDFPLSVRLKLAVYYLRSELGDNLYPLSDISIEKILLDRMSDYFLRYLLKILLGFITKNYSINELPNSHPYLPDIKKIISDWVVYHSHLLMTPERRNIFIKYLQSINYQQYTNVQSLKKVIGNVCRLAISHIKNTHSGEQKNSLLDSTIQYSMGYYIASSLGASFSVLLQNAHFKKQFYPYSSNKIYDYIVSTKYPFKKYFSITEDDLWQLEQQVLAYGVRTNDYNIVCNQSHTFADDAILCEALRNNNLPISEKLLLNQPNHRRNTDTFITTLRLALSRKNYKFLKIALKSNYCHVDLQFLHEFLLQIESSRKYSLLPMLLSFAARSTSGSAEFSLEEIISRIPKEIFQKYVIPYINIDYKLTISCSVFQNFCLIQKRLNEDSKIKNAWLLLLTRKTNHNNMKRFFKNINDSNLNKSDFSLEKLAHVNYKKLIQRLTYPSFLSENHYEDFMEEKGNDRILSGPSILTAREKNIFTRLINMKWKLAHFVLKLEDLNKIIAEKEIRSIQYRQNSGEFIRNQNSPSNQMLEGFVFLTMGPAEAPIPNFLLNSGGIIFDVQALLKKKPTFFKHAFVTSHWYSFGNQTRYDPINYMGTTAQTYHTNTHQYNIYRRSNNKVEIKKHISDVFFNGDGSQILTILCLLFIEKIRHLGGKFYQFMLENADNEELLSRVYANLMHPGFIEIRYPYAIPLDFDFCEVKQPKTVKTLSEIEVQSVLSDVGNLKKNIGQGFDVDSTEALVSSYPINKSFFVRDLLTRAILNKNEVITDFLIENGSHQLLQKSNGFLSPLEAATIIKDLKTILKLSKGMPISGIPNTFGLPQTDNTLNQFLGNLSPPDLLKAITDGGIAIIDDLLFICCKKLINEKESTPVLIIAIKQLLQKGANPNYSISGTPSLPLNFAINAGSSEAVDLLLKYNATYNSTHNQVELILDEGNIDLLNILVLNGNEYSLSKLSSYDLLTLFIASQENLFRKAVAKIYKAESTDNIENLLMLLLNKAYAENDSDILSFIYHYTLDGLNKWQDQNKTDQIFKILFDMTKFPNWLLELSSLHCVSLILEHQSIPVNLLNIVKFIIANNFNNKSDLFDELSDFCIVHSSNDMTIPLFDYLSDQPNFFIEILSALSKVYTHKNLNFLLKLLFSHNYFYKRSENLYTILSQPATVLEIIKSVNNHFEKGTNAKGDEVFSQDTVTFENFAKWLLYMVNNKLSLKNLLLNDTFFALKEFISPYSARLLHYVSVNENKYRHILRLKIFINHLMADSTPIEMAARDNYWAIKERLIQYSPLESNLQHTNRWTFFHNMNVTEMEKIKLYKRESAVALITCLIQGAPYVYLGKKKYSSSASPELLAPGGYINSDKESILQGTFRELKEETNFSISLPPKISKDFQNGLSIQFTALERSTYHLPHQLTLIYEYNFFHQNANYPIHLRKTYFIWLDYQSDLSQCLSSNDDFADGKWIPLQDIIQDNEVYNYKDQIILQSNGMLIDIIQKKYVSRDILQEVLFEEIDIRQHKGIAYSKTFFQPVTNKSKLATNDNNNNKKQKVDIQTSPMKIL